ncbi:MAG TPA: small ribosomal subunit Rsm22 family protein [Rectinemataceae bacterium]|nr:small ribosomal subunit Rsm22 family protein [Rectinemataceae bacterium]
MARIGDIVVDYYPALEGLAAGSASGQGAALKSLQRGLTGYRRLAGASYFSHEDYLGAYLLYYWPVSFVQVSLALEELRMRGALPRISDVLDIGAGPGPASFAALHQSAERVTLMDSNAEALEAALRLKGLMGQKGAEFRTIQKDFEKNSSLPSGPFDLIVACHSANELWKEKDDAIERRAALFEKACERLTDGGILLVVEPSANVTGRPALALRDRLLENLRDRGMSCVAPCPGSFACPIASAGEGRSCHSTWPWEPSGPVAALAKSAGLDRDSAKATWFALKKGAATDMEFDSELNTNLDSKPGIERADGDRLIGRVVSEPMLNKAGRVRYIVCAASGLASLSAKAGDPGAQSAGFFSLRRGDCIEAEALEKRSNENSFGFAPGTKLRVALRAPEA